MPEPPTIPLSPQVRVLRRDLFQRDYIWGGILIVHFILLTYVWWQVHRQKETVFGFHKRYQEALQRHGEQLGELHGVYAQVATVQTNLDRVQHQHQSQWIALGKLDEALQHQLYHTHWAREQIAAGPCTWTPQVSPDSSRPQ